MYVKLINMKTSQKLTHKIYSLIDQLRLFEAMDIIRAHDKTNVCRSLIEECSTNYKYLLKYFSESAPGTPDPSRASMVSAIKENLRRAADLLEVSLLERESSSQYFTTRRNMSVQPQSDIFSLLTRLESYTDACLNKDASPEYTSLQRAAEQDSEKLFGRLWTKVHISKSEQERLHAFLLANNEADVLVQAKALVLTALLLGCMMYYDYRKLELLLRSCLDQKNPLLAARAVAGALILIGKYSARIKENNSIMALLETVADNERLLKAVRQFVPAMLRAIDTDRVNKRVNEEIFPELKRMKPEIEKTLRRMGTEIDRFEIEDNPDWEDILNKSGVADKLKELTEMQMDGADIFMSAFSQMKGFSFFRSVSNWFVPFSLEHTKVKEVRGVVPDTILKMLTRGNYFCSSDKYSMVLALSKMPPQQFKMMSSQLSAQMESMQEDIDTSLLGAKVDISTEIGLYLKDLYRFFRLKNEDLPDPFGRIYEIPEIAPFKTLATDVELQRNIAEFYFKYGYRQQAYNAFETVKQLSRDADEIILQKQGYCMQLLGHNDTALQHYLQAELLNPNSDWLLKRIATLLRDMKRYEESAKYARRALERKPDNINLELLLGVTLMLGGNPTEALKSFYKIKYLNPENTKVLRPIAWCEFLLGNYEKSADLYDRMPDVNTTDMLNRGHSFMAMGKIADATDCYRASLSLLGGKTDEFRKLIDEDMSYLTQAGVTPLDIKLVTELTLS